MIVEKFEAIVATMKDSRKEKQMDWKERNLDQMEGSGSTPNEGEDEDEDEGEDGIGDEKEDEDEVEEQEDEHMMTTSDQTNQKWQ